MATRAQILDEILTNLADEFEAGNRKGRWFAPSCAEEFEPLRECIVELVAEGSATSFVTPQWTIVRLTSDGYQKYKPRVDALRRLPR